MPLDLATQFVMAEMDTEKKIKLVKNSYASLVLALPINEIINPLHAKGILTSTALKEIRALPISQSKTMYLLDNFILRGLSVGVDRYFDSLVEVLLECENTTAQTLGENLRNGEVVTTAERPAINYSKLLLMIIIQLRI